MFKGGETKDSGIPAHIKKNLKDTWKIYAFPRGYKPLDYEGVIVDTCGTCSIEAKTPENQSHHQDNIPQMT